jgi:hypothetical protein
MKTESKSIVKKVVLISNAPEPELKTRKDDMAAGWLHKVRTASGSDRVVSEMLDYGGYYKTCPIAKNETIVHVYRSGRYRSRF